jgi:exosortase
MKNISVPASNSGPTNRRQPPQRIVRNVFECWILPGAAFGALVATLLFLFPYQSDEIHLHARSSFFEELWSIWMSSELSQEYSYCILVPFIVAWLIWVKRGRLALTPISGNLSGIGWTALGLLLFWMGARSGVRYLGFTGVQIILGGGILWFWGYRIFKVLLFPWAMFSFFWPLLVLDSLIGFPLRLYVSRLCNHVLNFSGIPCIESGTALFSTPDPARGLGLGDRFRIDIADPCSGMHSLLALLMLSALYAHVCLPRTWQRWSVFLSAIPLAVFGNLVRLFMLVAGSLFWGTAFAVGTNENPSFYHLAAGFAVVAVMLALEYLLGTGLVLAGRKWGTNESSRAVAQARGSPPATAEEIAPTRQRSGVFFGLTLAMVALGWVTLPPATMTEGGVAMELPDEVQMGGEDGLAKFYGFPAPVTEIERRLLPNDTQFARDNYTDFRGHTVFFSVVLSSLLQFKVHHPEVCLVGQGWVIDGQRDEPIALASGRTLWVRNLLLHRQQLDREGHPHLVQAYHMFWYVTDGMTTLSYVKREWVTVRDRTLRNRDDRWAYIAVMSAITQPDRVDGFNGEQTIQMLKDFIRRILPTVQKSEIPGPG